MKKANNKGMTLVELIVSFILVSVAMLYFFQTLRTVQKVYKKSVDQTNEYVNFDYAFRIIEAAHNENNMTGEIASKVGADVKKVNSGIADVDCYEVTINGVKKKLYLYHE